MWEKLDFYETQEDKINDTISFLWKKVDHIGPQEKEVISNSITLVEQPERSTSSTTCYMIILDWKEIWDFQCFWQNTKSMLMTSWRSPALFETVSATEQFPDEEKIRTNLLQTNEKRKVSIIFPWPTYESWNMITGLAVDNGELLWQSTDLTSPTVSWKWLLIIVWGKLIFTHTSEKTQADIDGLINEKRDLCTLPSIKRNGNINNPLLQKIWVNWRFLVEMSDGRQWVITLKWYTPDSLQKIFSDPLFSRILYCDWIWNKWQMDGWRIEDPATQKLVYTNHTKVVWRDEVKWNMPAVFVVYIE